MNLVFLLLGAWVGLIGLGVSGILVRQSYLENQRVNRRLAAASCVSDPSQSDAAPVALRINAGVGGRPLWKRAVGIFGFDPDRREYFPRHWWLILFVTFVMSRLCVSVLVILVGPLGRFALIPVWIGLTRFVLHWFERRRSTLLFKQFPDALGMIVRSVRVGIPVGEALRVIAGESLPPTSREFSILSDEIAIGVALDEALRRMAVRNQMAEYRFFATALALQAQTGGGLAETLEGLADVIRKRVASRARARALASEANASATILAVIPMFTAVALVLVNPSYISILLSDPNGHKLIALAAFLLCTGIGSMKFIIRKTLS